MRLALQQSNYFWADLQKQVDWYRDHASSEVAERYIAAMEAALKELAGFHSWRVRKPCHRHLIFNRFDDKTLWAERVLHGARDLPRRLRQSPYERE